MFAGGLRRAKTERFHHFPHRGGKAAVQAVADEAEDLFAGLAGGSAAHGMSSVPGRNIPYICTVFKKKVMS